MELLRYNDDYGWILGNRLCCYWMSSFDQDLCTSTLPAESPTSLPWPIPTKILLAFFKHFFLFHFFSLVFLFSISLISDPVYIFCLLWAYFSFAGFIKVENWFVIALLFRVRTHTHTHSCMLSSNHCLALPYILTLYISTCIQIKMFLTFPQFLLSSHVL